MYYFRRTQKRSIITYTKRSLTALFCNIVLMILKKISIRKFNESNKFEIEKKEIVLVK